MQPVNQVRLGRIKRISGVLRVLCLVFMLLCVLALLGIAGGPIIVHEPYWGIGTAWYTYSDVQFKVYSMTLRERVIAATFLSLYWGTAILSGLQLFRLLGFYSRGEIFTKQSAGQIRQWGIACVAWGIVKVGYGFLPLLLANSRGRQGGDLGLIVTGLGIVAISWFMELAAEMREENDLTV